jgi:PAS domain S-box-containing protein
VRCDALLESVLDPLVIIDHHGVIQETSLSTLDVLGWARDDLVGRNVSILMPEPHRSDHDAHIARYLATGEAHVICQLQELPVVRRDGRTILCELSISRIDVEGIEEPHFIGSFRDVTGRREIERRLLRRERTLDAVFEQESAFLGILSLEGRVLRLNRPCLDAMGLDTDTLRGRMVWTLPLWGNSRTQRAQLRDAVSQASRGTRSRFDVVIATSLAGTIHASLAIKAVEDDDGMPRFLLFEAHDVTDLRQAEQAEVRMQRSLAEIGETAAELVHEIKNPLTGIHLALRSLAGKLGEDEAVLLDDLAGRLHRLQQQMRRTLQFARSETPAFVEVDGAALLADAADAVAPRLTEGAPQVRVSLPSGDFSFLADADMLHGALVNLLHNALDAGANQVHLRARPLPRRGGMIRLVVEDDGPGIPPDRRERVFQPFISDKPEGSGLGLALARKAAESHGGSIDVDGSHLGGARFTILLPPDGGLSPHA